MDPPAIDIEPPRPPPQIRRRSRGARWVEFTLIFTIIFAVLTLIKLEPFARNSVQVQNQNSNIDIPGLRDGQRDISISSSRTVDSKTLQNAKASGVDSVIKKRSGGGGSKLWTLVDWHQANQTIHPEEEGFDCEMTAFESSVTHKRSEMCVHTLADRQVSDAIRRSKRWRDCDVLSALWNESQKHHLDDDHDLVPVYLEIGANIGSCVMEMLMETDAQIIAFEPHPRNLYNLKRTFMNLGKTYQDRIRLFPVGLGKDVSTNTIYAPKGNMGNAIIETKVKDNAKQEWDDQLTYTVNVERLDSILQSENIHIKLVKMDAQGFECNILEGMGSALATKIDILKFEWAKKWLDGQSCHDLLPRLQDFGLTIYKQFDVGANKPFRTCLGKNASPSGVIDLFAVRQSTDEMSDNIESNGNFCGCNTWKQTQISCAERVQYLVRTYQLSEQEATGSLLEQGCQCTGE